MTLHDENLLNRFPPGSSAHRYRLTPEEIERKKRLIQIQSERDERHRRKLIEEEKLPPNLSQRRKQSKTRSVPNTNLPCSLKEKPFQGFIFLRIIPRVVASSNLGLKLANASGVQSLNIAVQQLISLFRIQYRHTRSKKSNSQ